MNAYTQIAIKTTQVTMHRGNQRLWLQNASEMLESGFLPNSTYSTEYLADSIVLRLAIASECRVRKVSATARGATLDINNNRLKAYDFSNGIKWHFLDGQINITPIKGA
jgi:hypothetical protein|tara:strand:- start:473 stop:799 length:327 start_codon:yes stop_codon:yes gene_type:complete